MDTAPVFPPLLAVAGIVLVGLAVVLTPGRVPLRYTVRNLLVRWRTTLLTTLSFALVVGLVTVMVALVRSINQVAAASGRPWNVMVLSDGATDEIYSGLDYGRARNIELHPAVLRDGRGLPLSSWELYVIVNQPVSGPTGQRKRRFIQLRGLDDVERAAAVHGLELHPGSAWFSGPGVQPDPASGDAAAIQAVIGEGLARELGRDGGRGQLTVGDTFEAGPRRWVVTGVMKSAGTTFDSEVWAKRQLVGQAFHRDGHTTLTLRAADASAARGLARDLSLDYKHTPVNAVVEADYYDRLKGTNRQFLGATLVVTVILSVGGAFGMMNTMFAAVARRTKDIGLLRVLGFSRRQILASFLLEAVLMAAAGGLAGCALGTLADGWTANSIISAGQGAGKSVIMKLSVDRDILLTGMLFALGMGLVSGLAPAVAAMRLRPLDAMR